MAVYHSAWPTSPAVTIIRVRLGLTAINLALNKRVQSRPVAHIDFFVCTTGLKPFGEEKQPIEAASTSCLTTVRLPVQREALLLSDLTSSEGERSRGLWRDSTI